MKTIKTFTIDIEVYNQMKKNVNNMSQFIEHLIKEKLRIMDIDDMTVPELERMIAKKNRIEALKKEIDELNGK